MTDKTNSQFFIIGLKAFWDEFSPLFYWGLLVIVDLIVCWNIASYTITHWLSPNFAYHPVWVGFGILMDIVFCVLLFVGVAASPVIYESLVKLGKQTVSNNVKKL